MTTCTEVAVPKLRKREKPVESLIYPEISHKPVNNEAIEGMTRETDRMVSGTFINIECPGQPAKVSCKYYKGMPYFSQTLEDGEEYRLPLSVSRHINERCFNEPHSYLMNDKGEYIKSGKKIFRYKFMTSGV